MATRELEDSIGRLRAAGSSPPIESMEELISGGEAAVSPLTRFLDEIEPDEDDWTPLWCVVVLGEIGSPAAVPSLLRILSLPDGDVLAEAAVEALAKTGEPALPSLFAFARAAAKWEARHYAYSAIGLIPSGESSRFLAGALQEDPLLWGSIAMAMADLGDAGALPVLRALKEQAGDRELPAVEEAIRILEGRQPPYPGLRGKDWRIRLREMVPEE